MSSIFLLVAEDVREIMASLGIRKFDDLIGRSDLLIKQDAIDHWKAKDIDLSKILWSPETKVKLKTIILLFRSIITNCCIKICLKKQRCD